MTESVLSFLRSARDRLSPTTGQSRDRDRPAGSAIKFVDLAPTEDADQRGVYSEALQYATSNARVFNIALTGPYGSGKSSIIRSFLKRYPRKALHISLAAFAPDGTAKSEAVGRQEIERSILQQMLYGADANRLPLSRFKRIRSPGLWSFFKTLFALLGVAAVAYLLQNRAAVISGAFLRPFDASNWFHLGTAALATLFLWMTIHHFYVASFGVSLKSISLKDIEIRPTSDNQDSILNRHLDEIIYFFQRTSYDLVIIEDLDRFDDSDIFVTLREINGLVNANAGVRRRIRFLYALRDDMFVNTDRTKFFEFIIPVIPIINASNSVDMVLRQGNRLSLDERLDRQFLREVSRYLGDLRLITNIFNEYAIYAASLEADEENLLDANKLLAVLIYKNVYPKDFELLHRGEGNLAKILGRHDELVAEGEAAYRSKIADLEQRIEAAERQTPANLRELRQVYVMTILGELPQHVARIKVNGQDWIEPHRLADQDDLEPWLSASHIGYQSVQGYQQQASLRSVQDKVDPERSYSDRKREIEEKAGARKAESLRQMTELRTEAGRLRAMKFNELIRVNLNRIDDLFDGVRENGELARFLILEGYLDDTFYQYTSLFHSGRLSPNDNKFLIQIRAFRTPGPEFPLDNAREVVAAMRNADFGQSYVLNVKLVDCLLGDPVRYAGHISKLLGLVSSEFDACEEFLEAYYVRGQEPGALLERLLVSWEEFIPTALSSRRTVAHATQLLVSLSNERLEQLARGGELPGFVADHLPDMLAMVPDLSPDRLLSLGFAAPDLHAIERHPGIARKLVEAGRFELTIGNLEYVYREILGGSDVEALRRRNYTTLRAARSRILNDRIEREFATYFEWVLLRIESNSEEDASSILAVASRDEIDIEEVGRFVKQQAAILPELGAVPERLHAMLFQLGKIRPTWANCLTFLEGGGFDPDSLSQYLGRDDIRAALLLEPMPSGPSAQALRDFIVEAEVLSDAAYRDYVRHLPQPLVDFPAEIGRNKRQILVEERLVKLSGDSFETLADHADLQLRFVATNIDAYLAEPDALAVDDTFREELLTAGVNDAQKAAVIGLMDLDEVVGLPGRAALLGPLIDRLGIETSDVGVMVVKSLILHSTPIRTQVSLLNKLSDVLTDDDVREVLARLPPPYSEIKTGYLSPRLESNAENLDLVRWLDSRNIISSWKSVKGFYSDELRVNLYRR